MTDDRPPVLDEELERRLENLPRSQREQVRNTLLDAQQAEPEQASERPARPRPDIMDAPGVGPKLAQRLREAGLGTPEAIAAVGRLGLEEVEGIGRGTATAIRDWAFDWVSGIRFPDPFSPSTEGIATYLDDWQRQAEDILAVWRSRKRKSEDRRIKQLFLSEYVRVVIPSLREVLDKGDLLRLAAGLANLPRSPEFVGLSDTELKGLRGDWQAEGGGKFLKRLEGVYEAVKMLLRQWPAGPAEWPSPEKLWEQFKQKHPSHCPLSVKVNGSKLEVYWDGQPETEGNLFQSCPNDEAEEFSPVFFRGFRDYVYDAKKELTATELPSPPPVS